MPLLSHQQTEGDLVELRLILISPNMYLSNALSCLLTNLLPSYVQKTGRILDVIYYKSIDEISISPEQENSISYVFIDKSSAPGPMEAIMRVAEKLPDCRRFLLLAENDSRQLGQCTQLSMQLPLEQLSHEILTFLTSASAISFPDITGLHSLLNEDEKAVLDLMVHGWSVKRISERLSITPQKIYSCRNRIMKKAGVDRLHELLQHIQSSHFFTR